MVLEGNTLSVMLFITLAVEIIKALDRGVFIDFKRAFDKSIIVYYCEHRIGSTMHDWLKSYLTNRMQYTHLKNNSTNKRLIWDVSQGSILDPLLFIIYVNDLHGALNDSYCLLPVDDIYVFIKTKTTEL